MSQPSEVQIREWTRTIVCQMLKRRRIGDATSWRELGVDSTDFVMLIMDLDDKFGTNIPSAEFDGIDSINDAVTCIQKQLSNSEEGAPE